MTVDLACLVVNALWGLVLVFVEVGGKTRVAGSAWNAGNREIEPESPDALKMNLRRLKGPLPAAERRPDPTGPHRQALALRPRLLA